MKSLARKRGKGGRGIRKPAPESHPYLPVSQNCNLINGVTFNDYDEHEFDEFSFQPSKYNVPLPLPVESKKKDYKKIANRIILEEAKEDVTYDDYVSKVADFLDCEDHDDKVNDNKENSLETESPSSLSLLDNTGAELNASRGAIAADEDHGTVSTKITTDSIPPLGDSKPSSSSLLLLPPPLLRRNQLGKTC